MHRKLFHLATSELHWSMENAMETIQITTPRQMAVVPRIRAAKKWPSWPNTSSRSRISTFSPSLVSTHHKPIERGVNRSRNHPSKPPASNTLTRLHRALATMDRLKAMVTKRGVKIHVIPTLDLYNRYNGENSGRLWARSTCLYQDSTCETPFGSSFRRLTYSLAIVVLIKLCLLSARGKGRRRTWGKSGTLYCVIGMHLTYSGDFIGDGHMSFDTIWYFEWYIDSAMIFTSLACAVGFAWFSQTMI